MFPNGKCPKCDKVIQTVNHQHINVGNSMGQKQWNGIAYLCPACSAILSVGIDPVALSNDIISRLRGQ